MGPVEVDLPDRPAPGKERYPFIRTERLPVLLPQSLDFTCESRSLNVNESEPVNKLSKVVNGHVKHTVIESPKLSLYQSAIPTAMSTVVKLRSSAHTPHTQ